MSELALWRKLFDGFLSLLFVYSYFGGILIVFLGSKATCFNHKQNDTSLFFLFFSVAFKVAPSSCPSYAVQDVLSPSKYLFVLNYLDLLHRDKTP